MSLESVIEKIRQRKAPQVILVGGNNEYLVEQAFRSLRDAFLETDPSTDVEQFPPGVDLAVAIDGWRTHSLFGGARLLIVPELQAFVTRKDIDAHLGKALDDWRSAKTDRKRGSAIAKLMHALGLVGADLEESDSSIAQSLAVASRDTGTLSEMLATARSSGRRSTRGEGDAALLAEAIHGGGAPGATLMLRSGDVPRDSATLALIAERGAVVLRDLTREGFNTALAAGVEELSETTGVQFEPAAVSALRRRMGIERLLADKFSKEVPELRSILNEAERLATLAGTSGTVTAAMVEGEVAEQGGGARFEFTSLWTEGKLVEAVEKLRELIAQARREDPRTMAEIHYGRFLFPLADEIRQSIAILSFCRLRKIDPRRAGGYNQFRDSLADALGEFLKERGLARQKPHPFPLFKKFDAARRYNERTLMRSLGWLAEIDFQRKSGGAPIDVSLELFVLSGGKM